MQDNQEANPYRRVQRMLVENPRDRSFRVSRHLLESLLNLINRQGAAILDQPIPIDRIEPRRFRMGPIRRALLRFRRWRHMRRRAKAGTLLVLLLTLSACDGDGVSYPLCEAQTFACPENYTCVFDGTPEHLHCYGLCDPAKPPEERCPDWEECVPLTHGRSACLPKDRETGIIQTGRESLPGVTNEATSFDDLLIIGPPPSSGKDGITGLQGPGM